MNQATDRLNAIRPYWQHLRLPFQLTLAPLFLWGFFLAQGHVGSGFVIAFISLHLFLYPGITAFNSAYDRDEGPVSGMIRPPPVPKLLLPVSVALQGIGALLAAAVGAAFLAIYAALAVLAALYSHPRSRWKAHPWGSAATVALGQGGLGFLAGWAAAAGGLAGVSSAVALLGVLAAILTTLGLYPGTQVFQLEEDAARGDRTLALALGVSRALRLGSACLLVAGVATMCLAARMFGAAEAGAMVLAYAAILVKQERFARRLSRERLSAEATYRQAMHMNLVATAGFLAFISYQMLANSQS